MNKDFADINVLILAGGQGSRLRSVSGSTPKGMVLIAGKPFLHLLYTSLIQQGFQRIIFCTGYGAEAIEEYFRRLNPAVFFSREQTPLGTAGAIKAAEKIITSDPFLVLNGDSLCDISFLPLIEFHLKKKALATIVAAPSQERRDGGYLQLNDSQQILRFDEKQYQGEAALNAGIYLFQREILKRIPAGQKSSLEHDILPGLKTEERYAFVTSTPVEDIGTPERLDSFRRGFRQSPEGALRAS